MRISVQPVAAAAAMAEPVSVAEECEYEHIDMAIPVGVPHVLDFQSAELRRMLRFLFAQLLRGFQADVLRERTGRRSQASLRFDSYFQRFSLKERRATASCLVSQIAAVSCLVADRER